MQQFSFRQIHLNQVGFELLDHLFQRCCDLRDGQNAGHVRTALERMQRALQRIGNGLRQSLSTIGKETDQRCQMRLGFVAEDFQQLRVECVIVGRKGVWGRVFRWRRRHLRRLRQYRRLPLCQCMRSSRQLINIVALTLCLGCKFVDQRGHQRDDSRHHLLD